MVFKDMSLNIINPTHVIYFGASVAKYTMPLELVEKLNKTFDEHKEQKKLESHNKKLVGIIDEEWTVTHLLNKESLKFLNGCLLNYIGNASTIKQKIKKIAITSCWFNDQKENEFNPIHIHYGDSPIGISSVLFLKVPDCINNAKPKNDWEPAKEGRLEFINQQGMFFGKSTHLVHPVVGDLYLFAYEMPHTVYPFKGEGIRRSMSFNVDIFLENLDGQEKK